MKISRSFLFMIITTSLCYQTIAQPDFYPSCYTDNGNYTTNSTYQHNLNKLLSTLTSNTEITYGFYNFTDGVDNDKVYAIGLCRGDVNPQNCRKCLNNSRYLLTQNCPNKKEAIGWIDECMLHYSHRSIFGLMETTPGFSMWSPYNATDVDEYNKVLGKLLYDLKNEASSGDSMKKFATANVSGPNFQDIYSLMQCPPDVSSMDCNQCLDEAIARLPSCCENRIGARVVRASCTLRYEKYRFYELTGQPRQPPPPPNSPSTNNTSSQGKAHTPRIITIIGIPVVIVVLVLCFICIYLRLRLKKPNKTTKIPSDAEDEITTFESLLFDFDTIRVATNDFNDSNKLGEGGFGAVYQGKLLNGQVIAVKRLSMNSGQGDIEFKNEVLLMAKLQHRNLVRLLGFTIEGRERLLVYEFVPNKSLDFFIFDPIKKTQLDWEKRYKIIQGISRGVLYLHEDSRLRIIHRDLKASNILLDGDMNAKISDFGMARLILVDQTQANTSRIVGTYGYMAPEYVMHGEFSVKSDVFSFGVLVLEIISGQKNSGIRHGDDSLDLLSFAWKSWREGTAASIIDSSLYNSSRNEILRCIHIGLLCVQDNVAKRPTMSTVVLMLSSYSLSLSIPSEPAFFMGSRTRSLPEMRLWEENSGTTKSSQSTTKSDRESFNEASFTDPYPR
ncbi:cysteine-rich receptor-like protein kinase 26 isoform X2 [Trifolium pratense]|uniref:cysteine-rich receptor-like protein kinase 26 isoform X2 n=1 Tax=Trifolium pratense TaxID=57577 RepID=UPI001E6946E9|nr:cysteine-rich receptor-like protein kinase 26 isoform X2 [Trifolium pratense]